MTDEEKVREFLIPTSELNLDKSEGPWVPLEEAVQVAIMLKNGTLDNQLSKRKFRESRKKK